MKRYRVWKGTTIHKGGSCCYTINRTNMDITNLRKLMNLKDRWQRNNLQILGINENPGNSWKKCQNRICDMLEEKLKRSTSNKRIEMEHCVGGKWNNKERVIVAQFSFSKDNINVLRNRKKLKENKISIVEDFSEETMQICKKWKEVLAKRKQSKISYLGLKVLFTRNMEQQQNQLYDFSQLISFY